jgi:37-kD nucleoid-associated bacterial protein
MNNHEVIVKNIILHILDTNVGTPVLSTKEIDPEQEGFDFVENLIHKMLGDDNVKNVTFLATPNQVQELCERLQLDSKDFISVSQAMANLLFEIMTHQPSIPSADLICCQLLIDGKPFLGLLKLNYRTNFIHHIEYEGETNVNLLVRQKTVLPGEHQKPEEAVLIDLDDFSIRLVEKEYEIDGKKDYYISKQFLACSDQLSTAQKVKIISKVAEKLGKKYNNEKFDSVARLRKSVAETMEESKAVAVESVAREIFRDDPGAQREYVEEVKQAGIREDEIQLSEQITERKFKSHKIKTDTGIEINFPSTYYNNKEMIEFVNHPNGMVSIIIKNVGKISNK